MTGRLIAIVGPSGVGKDSLMSAMAFAEPRLSLARRTITRPRGAGGEVFDSVSLATFQQKIERSDFALWWAAHGLQYGIPKTVDPILASGRDVLANLSRSVLAHAQARFDRFHVIALSAENAVLRERLQARGRESAVDIADRLARVCTPATETIPLTALDNSGPLEHTVRQALALLYPQHADHQIQQI